MRILFLILFSFSCYSQTSHHSTVGNKLSIDSVLSTQRFTQVILVGGLYCNPKFDSAWTLGLYHGALYYKDSATHAWISVTGGGGGIDSTLMATNFGVDTGKRNIRNGYIPYSRIVQNLITVDDSTILSTLALDNELILKITYSDTLTRIATRSWAENAANKDNIGTSPNSVKYPTTGLVNSWIYSVYSSISDSTFAVRTWVKSLVSYGIGSSDTSNWNSTYRNYVVSGSYSGTTLTLNKQGGGLFLVTGFNPGTVRRVSSGSGLSGGDITDTGTISMPNVGTASTFGDSVDIAIITTDSKGRISFAAPKRIDSTQRGYATWNRVKKIVDSLNAVISLKVNVSDSGVAYTTPYDMYFIGSTNSTRSVSGTISEVALDTIFIPAGSVGPNDKLYFTMQVTGSGGLGSRMFKTYINSTPNIGGSLIVGQNLTSSGQYSGVQRTIQMKNSISLNEVFNNSLTANPTDFLTTTSAITTLNIDFSVNRYLVITGTLTNIGDVGSVNNCQLIGFRSR